MARPTNKEALLMLADSHYQKLMAMVDSFSEEEQLGIFPFEGRDRQIRDCLVHLYEWHQLLLNWIASNRKGDPHSFLPEPYNWKTYPEMNVKFWEKHQRTEFKKAKKMLQKSHGDVLMVIANFSNDELFIKKYFDWTGSTSLGSYVVSSTSSHYDWAMKIIKQYKKSL